MSQRKLPPPGSSKTTNTELINFRFYENQKRQALTTTDDDDDVAYLTGSNDGETCSTDLNRRRSTTEDSLFEPPPEDDSNTPPITSTNPVAPTLATPTPPDKSRKGSVDQRIWNLVNMINAEKDTFFTTSSCSGRIILYTWDTSKAESTGTESKAMKQGCKWLHVTHDEVCPEDLAKSYFQVDSKCDVFFKMEPCILHVQCRTLTDARKLVHVATESGFRNSGMVIGKENRITVAIRSAMGLEVPLPAPTQSHSSSQSLISQEYLTFLSQTANGKMRENWTRSEKLATLFSQTWKK